MFLFGGFFAVIVKIKIQRTERDLIERKKVGCPLRAELPGESAAAAAAAAAADPRGRG